MHTRSRPSRTGPVGKGERGAFHRGEGRGDAVDEEKQGILVPTALGWVCERSYPGPECGWPTSQEIAEVVLQSSGLVYVR
jgi:hypothetical protein